MRFRSLSFKLQTQHFPICSLYTTALFLHTNILFSIHKFLLPSRGFLMLLVCRTHRRLGFWRVPRPPPLKEKNNHSAMNGHFSLLIHKRDTAGSQGWTQRHFSLPFSQEENSILSDTIQTKDMWKIKFTFYSLFYSLTCISNPLCVHV